jgi:acetyl-CoA acyltransferase
MRKVAVIGVGMTNFGKFIDTPIKELGRQATWDAIKDAGISPKDIQIAYVGNACLGVITGQAMVQGQIILKEVGVRGIPITNVENACASSSSAFREAWMAVASGMYDIALAVGAEKLYAGDTRLSTKALAGRTEVEYEANLGLTMPGHWALRAKRYMEKYGTTKEQLARVSVENHHNGCLNPRS